MNRTTVHVMWRRGVREAPHALEVESVGGVAILLVGYIPLSEDRLYPVLGGLFEFPEILGDINLPQGNIKRIRIPDKHPLGVLVVEKEFRGGIVRLPVGIRKGLGSGRIMLLFPEAIPPIRDLLRRSGWAFVYTPDRTVVGHRVDPYTGGVLGEIELWIEELSCESSEEGGER